MNFWKEWTGINIARLNSIFSSEKVKFNAVDFSDKLILVQSGKRRHIQPTYFVDSIGPAEALATINFVKSESSENSQISAAIPALESESSHFQKALNLNIQWSRSSYYTISLSGATAHDVLAGMD